MNNLGEYVTTIRLPLEFSVTQVYRTDPYGEEEELLQLRLGNTVMWTEPHDASLYYDGYGDGGPSIQEAIVNDVIAPVLKKLFQKEYGWDTERLSVNG